MTPYLRVAFDVDPVARMARGGRDALCLDATLRTSSRAAVLASEWGLALRPPGLLGAEVMERAVMNCGERDRPLVLRSNWASDLARQFSAIQPGAIQNGALEIGSLEICLGKNSTAQVRTA